MVKNIPKIAIVTRTQNRLNFLGRAIESVHGQTYVDFIHVIIVDGGDISGVKDILSRKSELTQGRVKLLHNDVSVGMEAASNKAIKSVDSQYIAIHDDDDTWHKDFLKLTMQKLEATNAAGVVARTDKVTEQVSVDGNHIKRLKTEQWMPDMKVVNLYRQCIDNQMTPITFVYRRSVLDEIGYYDETLPVLGDWDFGIRFLQKYDVEFLDPGYSLAFYHHRKYVNGANSNNSFGDGNEKHRYWSNRLMNKYLRQELADGRLGVGYIMSQLKYNQSNMATMFKKVLPNFVTSRLKRRIQN